jgi:hypothetical protein
MKTNKKINNMTNKQDCHPQPELIEMLKALKLC